MPLPNDLIQTGQEQLPLETSSRRGIVPLENGDAPDAFLKAARERKLVTWDIETSGLDWRSERIGLVQVWVEGYGLSIVRVNRKKTPHNLVTVLEEPSIQKIFHHAMFDLRFLCYHWSVKARGVKARGVKARGVEARGVEATNIVCTKIASKILNPGQSEGHTLAFLLQKYLAVTLDKTKRRSDWLSWDLSDDELVYAGNDVIHLAELFARLMEELRARKLDDLASKCFGHIPTQVQLDIRGYKDVFGY